MITVILKSNQTLIDRVEIKGHAKYDEFGKDIICAAVSATVLTTANAIIKIDPSSLTCIEEKNNLIMIINNHHKVTDSLIDNMVLMLREIKQDYPKHIKIIEEV